MLHVAGMTSVMTFDLLFPVWLYLTRDWYGRLIEHGEILSFLVWMHFMLFITLYVLYAVQVRAGLKLLAGNEAVRQDHRLQGKGILFVRLLVFATGAMLMEPSTGA